MAATVYRKGTNARHTLKRQLKRLLGPRNRWLKSCFELSSRPAAFLEETRSAIEMCQDDWDIDFALLEKNNP